MQTSVGDKPKNYPPKYAVDLIGLERDLAINCEQKAAWDAFVNVFSMIASVRGSIAIHQHRPASDRAPSIAGALASYSRKLEADLAACEALGAGIGDLYRSLTPQQRTRADRLFTVACSRLGWEFWSR